MFLSYFRYLKPLKKDKKKEEETQQALIELRNNASFAFWLINGLWILFNYMISSDSELSTILVFGYQVNPLGFVFLIFFMIILFFQFIGMLIHRWGTFLQLISITEIPNPFKKKEIQENLLQGGRNISPQDAIAVAKELTRFEPEPDYSSDEEYDDVNLNRKKSVAHDRMVWDQMGLRRRTPWTDQERYMVIDTVKDRMKEQKRHVNRHQRDNTRHHVEKQRDIGIIDLYPQAASEEEKRLQYLRGGGKASISRNFMVNNNFKRKKYQPERPVNFNAARRASQGGLLRGRRVSRQEDPHRHEHWLPHWHHHHPGGHNYHHQHVTGEDFDRQFHRRMNQYLSSSAGLPPPQHHRKH